MSVIFENMVISSFGIARNINFITYATSTTANVTVPISVVSGDILFLFDYCVNTGSGVPVSKKPTGFTETQNNTVNASYDARGLTSFKIANGTEANTILTGMSSTYQNKILVVIRPDFTVSNVNPKSLNSQMVSVEGSLSNYTILANNGNIPIIAYAGFNRDSNTAKTWSVTADQTLYSGGTRTSQLKLELYNSNPQAITVTGEATTGSTVAGNFGGYLEFS